MPCGPSRGRRSRRAYLVEKSRDRRHFQQPQPKQQGMAASRSERGAVTKIDPSYPLSISRITPSRNAFGQSVLTSHLSKTSRSLTFLSSPSQRNIWGSFFQIMVFRTRLILSQWDSPKMWGFVQGRTDRELAAAPARIRQQGHRDWLLLPSHRNHWSVRPLVIF